MDFVHSIVYLLDGKKAYILAISSAFIVYLMAAHGISPAMGILLQSIISILGGTAKLMEGTDEYQTYKGTRNQ